MITRHDRLLIELPRASGPNANAAAAVQELLGGKFGEMSTLMNYTFQSFNFRGRTALRPYYDLIANIAAEEYAHIELVSYAINALLTGATTRGTDPDKTPLEAAADMRNAYHFIASGQAALPVDSQGNFWTGQNVVSTGNLKMDLLHNFFLECGARANKIRVYEMTDDPVAREMVGFLLVRGGVHIVAYAKALEKLTGADVSKLLPIPDITNKKFSESKKYEDQGLHRILYHFSPGDYAQCDQIWKGKHPEDGKDLEFRNEIPEGFPCPDFAPEPQLGAPSADPDLIASILKKMG